jgi:hypothetical protein
MPGVIIAMPPAGTSLPNDVLVLFFALDFVPVGLTEPVIRAVVLSSISVGLSDSVAEPVLLAEDESLEAVAPLDALDAAVDLGVSVALVGSADSELS